MYTSGYDVMKENLNICFHILQKVHTWGIYKYAIRSSFVLNMIYLNVL